MKNSLGFLAGTARAHDDVRMPAEDEAMLDPLDRPATRRDLAAFATREDLTALAVATRRDLSPFATREDLMALAAATRRDLAALEATLRQEIVAGDAALRRDLAISVEELKRHFNMVAEQFKDEFRNLFDWTQMTTSTLGARLDRLEANHGKRLDAVELDVKRLKRRH